MVKMKLPVVSEVFDKKYPYNAKIKQIRRLIEKNNIYLKNKRVCVDIGAHVGLTAIEYAKIFDKVYAFEPAPKLYSMLVENTREIDNIETFNFAVSDRESTLQMFENPRNTESNFILSDDTKELHCRIERFKADGFDNTLIDVKTMTIDSLNLNDVDLIKIDTENYVVPVIHGMKDTLTRCRPLLQVEIFSMYDEVSQLLKSLRYQMKKSFESDYFFIKND